MNNFVQERRVDEVVTMIEKHEIVLMHFRDGKSLREISRETGISRPTVTKYVTEYAVHKQRLLQESGEERPEETHAELLVSLVESPHYDSSSRTKRKVTDALLSRVRELLTENAQKRSRGQQKQQMKIRDMHEVLLAEGFDLGYSRLCTVVRELEDIVPESFIRQAYAPGDVCEFDWGEVKLRLTGQLTRIQMGIFTSATGNYRYAQLFMKQDTAAFQHAHALFFEHLGGVYREVVYDNMRVAVKKFVGPTEKEATEGLLSLSVYYQFRFRFCNVRRGNEKGHVERSVEYVRRKAFSRRDEFADLDEANVYLLDVCSRLNTTPQTGLAGQTAEAMLAEERPYLLPVGPRFECGELREVCVDAYSTINVDTCRYSVPEQYVGQRLQVRVSPDQVIGYVDGQRVCRHRRRYGKQEWSLTLTHYLRTLARKPGALSGSVAFKQSDPRLQAVYDREYPDRPKDFIALLRYMTTSDKTLEEIDTVIQQLRRTGVQTLTTDMIKMVCERESAPGPAQSSSGIEQAASAQLQRLAELVPNHTVVQGGPVL
jgi:transposase